MKEIMLEYFSGFMSKETVESWDKALQAAFGVVGVELDKEK